MVSHPALRPVFVYTSHSIVFPEVIHMDLFSDVSSCETKFLYLACKLRDSRLTQNLTDLASYLPCVLSNRDMQRGVPGARISSSLKPPTSTVPV